MKLLNSIRLTPVLLLLTLATPGVHAQDFCTLTVLHNFGPTNQPPLNPDAPLLQGPDGTLYGTTQGGGDNNYGTVFKMQTNGTGLIVLRIFTNAPDGANPEGPLVLSGSRLYGTTSQGGTGGGGTVFAINTDGTGFTNLYNFQYGNDGGSPNGLILSGSTLYGTCARGGGVGNGTVFSLNTDGTDYTNLYGFTDGGNPVATVLLAGGTLYGTVAGGGTNGSGAVFAVKIDGTGFTNLYNFSALPGTTNADGAKPADSLTIAGNTLYGTAQNGGLHGSGTVFAVNTDGTGFTNLYNFSANVFDVANNNFTNSDGANPLAGLLVAGGRLYGAAINGGTNTQGTLFALNTNGTGFTVLKTLYDPRWVFGNLILSGATLYGASYHGGTQSDYGTVFSISTNGANYTTVYGFVPVNTGSPRAGVVLAGGTLFGTTFYGGTNDTGAIFAVGTNGTGYTVLHSFTGGGDGANPAADLILSNGTLYGTALNGNGGNGTVFAISTNGTGFTVIHAFTGGSDGRSPQGGLVLSGSTLYGTSQQSGLGGQGTVFAVNTSGTPFAVLHSFSAVVNNTNSDGANPAADLILSGSTLYGTAQNGGVGGNGTVFAVTTSSNFTTLHSFSAYGSSNTNSDGAQPQGGLVLAGGRLYGTAFRGGPFGGGSLFALNPGGNGFTVLNAFGPINRDDNPLGNLILSGPNLIGNTQNNSVYAVNTNGSNFLVLYFFNGYTDGDFPGAGMVLSGGILYGTAANDGVGTDGSVFAIHALPEPLTVQSGTNAVVLSWINPLFSLQAAPAVSGPYTNNPAAFSPYTNALNGPKQFFRLSAN
jgi:uncharacterized repeat protein (TIGR03803 family)